MQRQLSIVDGRELQVFLPNNDYFDNIIICWYIFRIALEMCNYVEDIFSYICVYYYCMYLPKLLRSVLPCSYFCVTSTWDFCIVHYCYKFMAINLQCRWSCYMLYALNVILSKLLQMWASSRNTDNNLYIYSSYIYVYWCANIIFFLCIFYV